MIDYNKGLKIVFQHSKTRKLICFFALPCYALFLCHSVLTGLDARGFLFGPVVAMNLDKAFIPVRKTGKLPGPTIKVSSTKEYGKVCSFVSLCFYDTTNTGTKTKLMKFLFFIVIIITIFSFKVQC